MKRVKKNIDLDCFVWNIAKIKIVPIDNNCCSLANFKEGWFSELVEEFSKFVACTTQAG